MARDGKPQIILCRSIVWITKRNMQMPAAKTTTTTTTNLDAADALCPPCRKNECRRALCLFVENFVRAMLSLTLVIIWSKYLARISGFRYHTGCWRVGSRWGLT